MYQREKRTRLRLLHNKQALEEVEASVEPSGLPDNMEKEPEEKRSMVTGRYLWYFGVCWDRVRLNVSRSPNSDNFCWREWTGSLKLLYTYLSMYSTHKGRDLFVIVSQWGEPAGDLSDSIPTRYNRVAPLELKQPGETADKSDNLRHPGENHIIFPFPLHLQP